MANQKKITVYDIVLIGLMAALVFVGTYLHIDIPMPIGKTMIHFGNIFCLLAGMLLGGVRGGLAAGIGSMFYDIMDPAYISECWITFINKFMMAFVCGVIVSYGTKQIAKLHEQAENGQLQKKLNSNASKALLWAGSVALVVLAVFVVIKGVSGITALSDGSTEVAASSVIPVIAAFFLAILLLVGAFFGVRKAVSGKDPISNQKEVGILLRARLLGGVAGILAYVVLYLTKNFIFGLIQGQEMATIYATLLTKGSLSLITGSFAVVISLVLVPYFTMAMQKAGFDKKLARR
jgi:uncharacterized membrane protein